MASISKYLVLGIVAIVLAVSLGGCGGSSGGTVEALAAKVKAAYERKNSAEYVEASIALEKANGEALVAAIEATRVASANLAEFQSSLMPAMGQVLAQTAPAIAPALDDAWTARVEEEQPELCAQLTKVREAAALASRAASEQARKSFGG